MERRLSAIFAADMVGYSRLMEADESGTHIKLALLRKELIYPMITKNRGRIVKLMGDGILVEFACAIDAVRCAIALQESIAIREQAELEDRRVIFRIGLNLDNVIIEGDDIYGDGINIAARLEGMAEPGGVLISHSIRDDVADQIDTVFFDNGERKFKNISRAIRVWSWPRKLPSLRALGKPLVFVAGFEGRGSEEEARLTVDLRDELRAHLARLTGLVITADQTSAHYVVKGGVRFAAGRTRIFARLIAVDGNRQIWSNRYEENTGDIFEVLDRSAAHVATSVRRRIAADDAAQLNTRPLDELSLEELLSVAGVSFFTANKAGWRGGGEIAEQALELAPDNFMALAMAAAGLGLAENLYGYLKTDDAITALAFNRVNKALRATNRSDMLHVTHAGLLLYGRKRHRDAAAAARLSLELNPEYNMGLWMLGAAQVFSGQFDAGAQSAERAVHIDIQDPYVHLYCRIAAYAHLGAERYDEAIDWFQRADQLAPGIMPNLVGLAVSYWLDGDKDSTHYAVTRLMEQEPEFSLCHMQPLPYRDEWVWPQFVETLCSAGVPQ